MNNYDSTIKQCKKILSKEELAPEERCKYLRKL